MTTLYEEAKAAAAKYRAWAIEGFPGATVEELATMAMDFDPENDATAARIRSEKGVKRLQREEKTLLQAALILQQRNEQ